MVVTGEEGGLSVVEGVEVGSAVAGKPFSTSVDIMCRCPT